MDSRDEKHIEAITTAGVVPVLASGKPTSSSAERISSLFTIAAAAAGLISDGCESHVRPCQNIVFRLITR